MRGVAASDFKCFKELVNLLFFLDVFVFEVGYLVLSVSINLLQELSQIVDVIHERLFAGLELVNAVLQLSIKPII